jgi:energy-coupling factor transporter ATP-binding protein EcfA2
VARPFPGLRPFDLKDAFLFFGREQQTQELLDRLSRNRFLAVVGTSGSGKSSLVRAGLVPALYRGYLVGATTRWRIAVMRPGSAPMDEMANALSAKEALSMDPAVVRDKVNASSLGLVAAVKAAQLGAGESLLLVVDQFEEIFRFASERKSVDSGGEALLFVKSLLDAVDQFEAPIYVVITMRTDFLGDCTLFPDLPETLNGSQYLVPRLTREQRRDSIERPIEIAGAEIAPRLVQQVLNDVGDDPDQLPVMQHALARMYGFWKEKGQDVPIDFADYEKAGTTAHALDDHAQSIYEKFSTAEQDWTRKLFRSLTKMERGREVRRPGRLSRIFSVIGAEDAASRAAVTKIIEVFARDENSLLFMAPGESANDRIVDISHESLIRKWCRLNRWVKEEGESAEWYSDLQRDTRRQLVGEADYWVGPELSQVLQRRGKDGWTAAWAEQYRTGESTTFAAVEKFLAGSRKKEQRRRFLRYGIFAGVGLLVVTALFALVQMRNAQQANDNYQRLVGERQGELAEAQTELNGAKSPAERIRALAKIDQINRDLVGALKGEIDGLKKNNASLASNVQTLKSESDVAKAELIKLKAIAPAVAPKAAAEIKPSAPDMEAPQRAEIADLKVKAYGAESARRERDDWERKYHELEPRFNELADASRKLLASTRAGAKPDPSPATNAGAGASTPAPTAAVAAAPADLTQRLVRAVQERVESQRLPPPPLKNLWIPRLSAVRVKELGLTFVIDMGDIAPLKAKLWVLAGSPAAEEAIPEYESNNALSKKTLKNLGDCELGPKSISGYKARCYIANKDKVAEMGASNDTKSQTLGDVIVGGRDIRVRATGYNGGRKNTGIQIDVIPR